MGMGTVAGRAGWNPLHGWEPPFPDGCAWRWGARGGKEKEGPAEDCLPALLRQKASLGGTVGKEPSCPSVHLGPPTRAGSILTTLKRARGQKG